jgi:hypothetical protein
MILIQAIGIRFVLPPRARAVYQHGIGSGGAANRNTIHRMCLAVGPRNVTLPFTMKVTNQEKRKPSLFVMPHTVYEKEWRSQFTPKLARNSAHHSGRVGHRIEPKRPRHLLFHEVSPSHVDHDLPMGFNKTIGRLGTRHSSNDIEVVINQMLFNCHTKKFGIAVTTETSSIRTSVRPEKTEHRENQFLREVLETKNPVVPSGQVDKNQ